LVINKGLHYISGVIIRNIQAKKPKVYLVVFVHNNEFISILFSIGFFWALVSGEVQKMLEWTSNGWNEVFGFGFLIDRTTRAKSKKGVQPA